MQPNWDLIVVGAGVLGSFHAYFAAKRGWKTLLIERNEFPLDASVRNFGTLVPSAMTPGDWHRRGLQGIDIYRDLASQLPLRFAQHGTFYPATTAVEGQILREIAELGPQRGYSCQWLDAASASNRFTALNPDRVIGGTYFPDDARIEPRTLLKTLIPWLQANWGVGYLPRTVATGVDSTVSSATVSVSSGAKFQAKHVVVCGGADLRTLFPGLYRAAGFKVCKLQMCRVAADSSVRFQTNFASGLTLRRYAAFRMCPSWQLLASEAVSPGVLENGIHILMVQDADGSFVLGDSHEYSTGDLDDRYSSAIESSIVNEAKAIVRLNDWTVTERWIGIYSLLDHAELFRESPERRIHIVTGIGGKGMTTGPGLARESIADLELD